MRIPLAVAVVAVVVSAATVVTAQESRGTIIGRVTDPSGAVVAGAKVQVTHGDTNTSMSSVTNAEGNYEVPYLISGRYRVTVELQGFKTSVREEIEVRVADRITLDFKLEVGAVAESVTITGETPLLQSATASLGSVMDSKRATELPIAGGNAYHLARFVPGITATAGHAPGNPTQDLASGAIAVNGTRGGSSEATVDGVPNMYQNVSTYSAPPQDMVEEFKIQTSTYDASAGHFTGAVVNLTTKSGTNRLHGTGYFLDSRLRAVPWFSNKWLYDPTTGPLTPEKREQANPGWRYKRFGATASGALVLPKIYDGHNRSFWSFGFEGMNVRRQASYTGTFPTDAEKNGDFSALLKLGSQYQIYDPTTIALAPGGRTSRQALAGNIIPPARMDPIGKKIISYYPSPNTTGLADGRQNYFQIEQEVWSYRSMAGRLDHTFSEKHRVFARVSGSVFDQKIRSFPTEAVGNENNPIGYRVALDDVYVFSPSLLLNVRYGLVDEMPKTLPLNRGFDILSLGLPAGLLEEIKRKNNPAGLAFPVVTVDGFTQLGYGGGSSSSVYYHTFAGTLTKTRGNHSLRAGGEYRLMRENAFAFGNVAPALDFQPGWTRGPLDNSPAAPIGQGLASLLFGLPTGGSISVNASRAEQSSFSGLFLQDDWRVTRRLTINAGLRWEYETAATERFNRTLRGFDFSTPNPIEAQARTAYALAPIDQVPAGMFRTMGGLTFAAVNGQPRSLWQPDNNNFAPRIGLAWQVTRLTVMRGGYGVFFGMMGIDRQHVNQGGFSQATNLIPSLDNGLTFHATLKNPFPDALSTPPGASTGLRTNLGRSITFFNNKPTNTYVQRWSLSVQRELPTRVLFDLTYVGNRGTKLAVSRELDAIPAGYLSTSPVRDQATIDFLSAQVTNPFTAIADFAGTGLAAARIARSQLLRPFPQFTSISTSFPAGYSYYHSMQLNIERRFSRGLLFQTGWTWSKFMEATSYLSDSDARPYKTVSDLDCTHRFTVTALYELPLGPGKKLLPGVHGPLRHAVAGWQVEGAYEGQSGNPLGFGSAIFNGNLKDIVLPVSERSVERWFNVNAGFERASNKQLGSNIRTAPLRYSGIRGDGINNFDLSMMKKFKLSERVTMHFRLEGINALNHVQFADPNTTPTSTAFGTITAEKGHGQRQINMVLKVFF